MLGRFFLEGGEFAKLSPFPKQSADRIFLFAPPNLILQLQTGASPGGRRAPPGFSVQVWRYNIEAQHIILARGLTLSQAPRGAL